MSALERRGFFGFGVGRLLRELRDVCVYCLVHFVCCVGLTWRHSWGGMDCRWLLLVHWAWGHWCIWVGLGSSGIGAFAPRRFISVEWHFFGSFGGVFKRCGCGICRVDHRLVVCVCIIHLGVNAYGISISTWHGFIVSGNVPI